MRQKRLGLVRSTEVPEIARLQSVFPDISQAMAHMLARCPAGAFKPIEWGEYEGMKTVRALERRGLVEVKWMGPTDARPGDGGWNWRRTERAQ